MHNAESLWLARCQAWRGECLERSVRCIVLCWCDAVRQRTQPYEACEQWQEPVRDAEHLRGCCGVTVRVLVVDKVPMLESRCSPVDVCQSQTKSELLVNEKWSRGRSNGLGGGHKSDGNMVVDAQTQTSHQSPAESDITEDSRFLPGCASERVRW